VSVTLTTHTHFSHFLPPVYPSFPPDVSLEYDSDHLYITATRENQMLINHDRFASRRESWSGTSSRTIYVGPNFDLAKMTHSFADGQLTVKIPRAMVSLRKHVTL
jgi:HSP20 family molecular chaperone IbpA